MLGGSGRFFASADGLAALLAAAEADPADVGARAAAARQRATRYDWDDVAKSYEQLCERLAAGWTVRGRASGRRSRTAW